MVIVADGLGVSTGRTDLVTSALPPLYYRATMLEHYRPEHFKAVRAFAGKLDNFFYLKLIIRAHTEGRIPGSCWVWREGGRIVAFSATAFLNKDDTWLWGMRVDPECQCRGVATAFTRAQFKLIRAAGRTWAGLNTLDSKKPKAAFRVMEKLGFKLEDTQCDDIYWRRPRGVPKPRPRPFPGITARLIGLGRKTMFYDNDGWFNCRLLPARARWLNPFGRSIDSTPLIIMPRVETDRSGRRQSMLSIDVQERPDDFGAFVPRLLALVPKGGRIVVNYPSDWAREFRAAARAAIPNLRQDHGCWQSTWRIYGKHL